MTARKAKRKVHYLRRDHSIAGGCRVKDGAIAAILWRYVDCARCLAQRKKVKHGK